MNEDWRVDLRARVTWGESPEEIRRELVGRGINESEVDDALKEAHRERQAHFRKCGLRDLGLGGLSAAGAVLTFLHLRTGGSGRTVVAAWFLGGAALWLLYRGVARLLTGGKSEGAATNVED
jgi:hypothetical protein